MTPFCREPLPNLRIDRDTVCFSIERFDQRIAWDSMIEIQPVLRHYK